MVLISGYSSESDLELSANANNGSSDGLRPYLPNDENLKGRTALEDKQTVETEHRVKRARGPKGANSSSKHKKRKGKGPWASWSSSSEDNSDDPEDKNRRSSSNINTPVVYKDDDVEVQENGDHLASKETSDFYGNSATDYQGRSFLHPPIEENIDFAKAPLSFRNYLPKKLIHKFAGHGNGTTVVRMLPKTGHLFLSGGNDNKVKLWDMYHDRSLLRDYYGHSKAIKDVNFTEDGHQFLSTSFDQYVKIWDVETGRVNNRLNFSCTPNCASFRPSNSNELIVGLSNREIRHFDLRVSDKNGLVQVYDHHLSSIIALKYFPDGSKLISSSEDKTMQIWENQINIPIKQISDTAQYSMPYIDIHPEHNYFAAQSMDNTIYPFSMKPKYKRHPKKRFEGHKCAGFGIGFGFSSDGRYIASGDSKGGVFIWDWKTTRLLKQFEVPGKKAIVTLAWAPQETSKIVCAGNGEKIYLYD
ncbi:LADA_0B03290g1_1 [Lachancea dasiensis]|uniref:Pre-mRNA-processing factor 17 n=1 Tax=Lachancea dasiensis TaxID=1072105 RepID=A0A1G4ISV0_9SACH|nr:LADA_0B03290g1_1 [Lachancea dasiensis]